MRIIIGLGMLVVFICVFFIFFAFTEMVKGEVGCLFSEDIARDCDLAQVSYQFIISLTIIVFLSLVILGVLYVVFSHVFRIENPPTYIAGLFKRGVRRVYNRLA